jgi:hypothetical protein
MGAEVIDIVVSETGSRTVKRNLDELGVSAEKSASNVDALMAAFKASQATSGALQTEIGQLATRMGSLVDRVEVVGVGMNEAATAFKLGAKGADGATVSSAALEAEVKRLSGELATLKKAGEGASQGHERHTGGLLSLKKEIVAENRLVNFFAGSLNGLIPASSAAGEGMRLLAGAMIGGLGIGFAIEVVMAGLQLLGEKLEEQKKLQFEAADAAAKYAGMLREGREAVEEFIASLNARGKGETWITSQFRSIQQEAGRLGDEMTAVKTKVAAASGPWDDFKHALGVKTEVDELIRHLNQLQNELAVLQQKKIRISIDFIEKVVPAVLESEEHQRADAAKRAAAGLNDQSLARSKGQTWTREQTADIDAQTEALKRERVEVENVRNAETKATFAWDIQNNRLKAIDAQVAGLEEMKGKLAGFAAPIDIAQGRELAYKAELDQAQAARRALTEAQLASASEQEAIQLRLDAALVEEQVKRDRTLLENANAAAEDQQRIIDASGEAQAALQRKAMAEEIQLGRKGGSAHGIIDEVAPAESALRKLTEAERLLQKAEAEGSITEAQRLTYLGQLGEKLKDVIHPLEAVRRAREQEVAGFHLDAQAREAESKWLAEEKQLKAAGVTVTKELGTAERSSIASIAEANKVMQERDAIFEKIQGPQQKFIRGEQALDDLFKRGAISAQRYALEMMRLRLDAGRGSFADGYVQQLGVMERATVNFAARAGAEFGTLTNSLEDGFAQATARGIVFGENIGDALHQVAQEGLAALLAGLIKMGIQMVLNATIGTAAGEAATAASAGMAATTAAAWATAASYVSLATFGANAAPAAAAIAGTVALSEGLAVAGGVSLESGGYTGDVGRHDVAGVVHGREFVMNADATARNRPLLEAMNAGRAVSSGAGGRGGASMNVSIQNYGTSKAFEVQQLSPSEVRIMARDEARKTLHKEGPSVIAADLRNPNSRTSSALGTSTTAPRRR